MCTSTFCCGEEDNLKNYNHFWEFETYYGSFFQPTSRQLVCLLACLFICLFVCLFVFYGISTFVGYLMLNPFYTNKQFCFEQFILLIFEKFSILSYSFNHSFISNNLVKYEYSFCLHTVKCKKQFYFKQFNLA